MPVSVSDGLWVDNNVDAGEFRKALGSSLVVPGDSTGVVPRAGRLAGPGSPLAVTPTVPASMAVQVNAGKAHTFRSATYGGTLGIGPDGLATVPIPAAPASGSQWHRVYLLQRDTNAPASDATAGAVIDVVSGVAAGSPTAPVLPAGALLLGDVVIPAGATSVLAAHITDRPTYTAPRGGILPVANRAEKLALVTAGAAYPTLEVLELDTARRSWHDGTRFRYEGDRITAASVAERDLISDAYDGLRCFVTGAGDYLYVAGTGWVLFGQWTRLGGGSGYGYGITGDSQWRTPPLPGVAGGVTAYSFVIPSGRQLEVAYYYPAITVAANTTVRLRLRNWSSNGVIDDVELIASTSAFLDSARLTAFIGGTGANVSIGVEVMASGSGCSLSGDPSGAGEPYYQYRLN